MAKLTDTQLNAAFNMKPEEIIKYFNDKGLKTSYNWHEVYADAHAKAFTAAKMTELDLLKDTKNLLEKSLEQGQSYNSFKKEAMNLFSQKGWIGYKEVINPKTGEKETVELGTPRRIKTIFDSNINSAYAAGRYKEQLEEIDIAPYWQYMTVADERTRPEHAALHGKVFRADDPFWQNFYPPNGWGCRCFVRNLTKHELEKSGLKVEKTDGQFLTVNKKIGGEIKQIPAFKFNDGGITRTLIPDAGWETNVGKSAWGIDVQAWNKVKDMDEKIKYKFISKMAENPYRKEVVQNYIEKSINKEYRNIAQEITISWFTPQIVKALIENRTEPITPIISMKLGKTTHTLRTGKIERGQALSIEQTKKIYDYINNPDEIYIDTQDFALIYVKYLQNDEIIDGRNIIKIPIKINNTNRKLPVNYISTLSRIKSSELKSNKRYKKIE